MSLKEYRERYGLTQSEVVDEVCKRALARGDAVVPGLDQCALSRHENGHKRPNPYYQALYCEVYGATPAELGFRLALPGENDHPEAVDRREFLTGAAGFVTAAAMPPAPTHRLGTADIARLRRSIAHLYELDDQHGAGSVYAVTVRTFHRLRGLTERASYGPATGRSLRELTGLSAEHAGWLAFDDDRSDDARRWWLEALHRARLADADSVSVVTMAAMALQASDHGRPREAIDLAMTAQSIAGRAATPRLRSMLLAREALGHAVAHDGTSAHAALRRAQRSIDRARDDDPSWIAFYGPANFASNECRVALALNDTAAAEKAARTALSLNDPVGYPRNHALYLIRLAEILAQRREIEESAAVAKLATVAAAGLESARITQGLHNLDRSVGARYP